MTAAILIGTAIALLVVVSVYVFSAFTKLPDNCPEAFMQLERNTDKVVVCMGDSITHGRVSHNYVDELAAHFADRGFTFVNAGINGELAYNLLQRIEQVTRIEPDFITILIGTNDALASLNEKNAARYVRQQKLPRNPDRKWYEENLVKLVDALQANTAANIALLSLPPSHGGSVSRRVQTSGGILQVQ